MNSCLHSRRRTMAAGRAGSRGSQPLHRLGKQDVEPARTQRICSANCSASGSREQRVPRFAHAMEYQHGQPRMPASRRKNRKRHRSTPARSRALTPELNQRFGAGLLRARLESWRSATPQRLSLALATIPARSPA
jgi:hypothetical protein